LFNFRSTLFVYTGETLIFEQLEARLFTVELAKKYVWVEFSRACRSESPCGFEKFCNTEAVL